MSTAATWLILALLALAAVALVAVCLALAASILYLVVGTVMLPFGVNVFD